MMRALHWQIQYNFYCNGQLRLIFLFGVSRTWMGVATTQEFTKQRPLETIEDSGISGQGA